MDKVRYEELNKNNELENYKNKYKRKIQSAIEEGLYDEAKIMIMNYEEIIKNDIEIFSFRAVINMLKGNINEAETILGQALGINPNNFDILYNLAYLYEEKENYDLAYYFYAKSIEETDLKVLKDEIKKHMERVYDKIKQKQIRIQQLRQIEFQKRLDRINFAKKQNLIKNDLIKENVHVVYVLTHVGICGGVKVILEHANNLIKYGANVTLVSHFPKPNWFKIDANYIEVPFEIELAKGIPNCDVIVATYWDHIQSCIEVNKAPVVYFEQGDFHLFDFEKTSQKILKFIKKQFALPEFIITVSNQSAKMIKNIYERESIVFHNSVDEKVFKKDGKIYKANKPYILMMGSDQIKFKGTGDVLDAHKLLKEKGYDLDLIWISSTKPSKDYLEIAKIFINPPQEVIASLYRGAFMYVSGSHYESFSLPCLEAMACGCPVVTTNNIGVREYLKNEYNSLFAKIGNSNDLVEKMITIVDNENLRNNLIINGLKTAENFKWKTIIPRILDFYKNVAKYKIY